MPRSPAAPCRTSPSPASRLVPCRRPTCALRAALVGPDTLDDRSIALSVHETYPAVDPSGIRDAAAKAIAATTAMQITAGDRTASEDAAGLTTLLVIDRTPAAPGTLEPIPSGATAPAARYLYSVRLHQARVTEWRRPP